MELQQTRHTDGRKASYQMIRNSVVKTQKTAISLKYSLPSIIKFDDIQPWLHKKNHLKSYGGKETKLHNFLS